MHKAQSETAKRNISCREEMMQQMYYNLKAHNIKETTKELNMQDVVYFH